jgi:hypothetical protein
MREGEVRRTLAGRSSWGHGQRRGDPREEDHRSPSDLTGEGQGHHATQEPGRSSDTTTNTTDGVAHTVAISSEPFTSRPPSTPVVMTSCC